MEILYKALMSKEFADKFNNSHRIWVEGYYTKQLLGDELRDIITDGAIEVGIDINTLGIYININDSEGNKVFSGDIFIDKNDDNKIHRTIQWVGGGFVTEAAPQVFGYESTKLDAVIPLTDYQFKDYFSTNCVVIGNIYENKDLLKL